MLTVLALLALLLAGTASADPAPDLADPGGAAASGGTAPEAPRPPPVDRLAGDPCGAAGLAHLVGGPAPDGPLLDEIRAGDGPPSRVRVIRPGQPVTMDHWPGRLNILLDSGGTVLALRCG